MGCAAKGCLTTLQAFLVGLRGKAPLDPPYTNLGDPLSRSNPMPWLAGGSLVALGVLVALLYLESRPSGGVEAKPPIRLYCAASMRPVMEAMSAEYLRETGERVEMEFGDSGRLLGQVAIRPDGDLFLPADDSYVRIAEEKGLVERSIPLCRMHAVVLCRPGVAVASIADLVKPGLQARHRQPGSRRDRQGGPRPPDRTGQMGRHSPRASTSSTST